MFFEIRIWKESESAIKLPDVSWSLKGDNSVRHIVQVLTKNHFFGWSNWSAKINFIHRTPQTFVWKLQPHLSMLQGDLQRINECEMWFYQWFEPFSLMHKLLEYLICLKLLRRLLFLFSFFFSILFSSKDLLFDCKSYHWGKKNNNK